MAERIAILYEVARRDWFSSLQAELRKAEVYLIHPEFNKVVLIDEEGEWQEVSEADFKVQIGRAQDTSFHWWFVPDHDLYCRVRRVEEVNIIEFGMEGCSEEELKRLREVFRKRFLHDQSRSLGLVFDPEGKTEGQNWDPFFLGGDGLEPTLGVVEPPLLLGFRGDGVLKRLRELSGLRLERFGELSIASW